MSRLFKPLCCDCLLRVVQEAMTSGAQCLQILASLQTNISELNVLTKILTRSLVCPKAHESFEIPYANASTKGRPTAAACARGQSGILQCTVSHVAEQKFILFQIRNMQGWEGSKEALRAPGLVLEFTCVPQHISNSRVGGLPDFCAAGVHMVCTDTCEQRHLSKKEGLFSDSQ